MADTLSLLASLLAAVNIGLVVIIFVLLRRKRFPWIRTHAWHAAKAMKLTEHEFQRRYPFGLENVETFPAAEFVCEKCGQNSFFSTIEMDPEAYTEEELLELDEGDYTLHGRMILHPNIVQCCHCGMAYYARRRPSPRHQDDEDEDIFDEDDDDDEGEQYVNNDLP